ncbi:methyl-accepting chemotaxis protein [Enterobacterales bacterium CwR94]|nr:methyl-accepting chemotaxis protein [Enterobacterales bacterium CwR94]
MKTFSPRGWSLSVRLSVMTSLGVALCFTALTLALSLQSSRQLEAQTRASMAAQVAGVGDMADMFYATLSSEVTNYTALFQSFLPKRFTVDENAPVNVNGVDVPTLRAGLKTLNLDQVTVDGFLERTGAIATIFVRSGDQFVRVSTSLKKEDGTRAVGTQLDNNSPAWQPVSQGEIFRGITALYGKRYMTEYLPIKDDAGAVIGLLFVGIDIGKQYALMREKILDGNLPGGGYISVLNGHRGNGQGEWLFHRKQEQQAAGLPAEVLQQPAGELEMTLDDGAHLVVWQRVPGWEWVITADVSRQALLAPIVQSRNLFLLTGGALTVLFAVVFLLYSRRAISQPLREVVTLANDYAAGKLHASLATRRQDEVGQLITAINGIAAGLQRIVAQVRDAASEISHGTDSIAQGSDNISEQIGRQASSVEQTSASMSQLSTTVERNADNVTQTLALVASAAQRVEEGGHTVARSAATMDAIRKTSQSIADITQMIESIAFQTNILALNAAVEAARAGEHGKGFAVVASEVRALAQRSAQAAKEIEALISHSLSQVLEGHDLSTQTQSAMENIVSEIAQVKTLMDEVNVASREQSLGIAQVNEAMQQIGAATQQNSDLVQQSTQTAQALSHKGHHLTQLVSIFQLKG